MLIRSIVVRLMRLCGSLAKKKDFAVSYKTLTNIYKICTFITDCIANRCSTTLLIFPHNRMRKYTQKELLLPAGHYARLSIICATTRRYACV